MNDNQRMRLQKVRNTAADFLSRAEQGSRFLRDGEDVTESMVEIAEFLVAKADEMFAKDEAEKT